jgi:hypothetical protein
MGKESHYAAMRESDDRLEVLQYLLDNHHLLNDIIYQNLDNCERCFLKNDR